MKAALLTLSSAILLALCLPPYNVEWVGWFAVAPVIVATTGKRPLEAMGLGMLASAICGILRIGWDSHVLFLFAGYVPFLWLALLVGTVTLSAALARPYLAAKNGLWWILFVGSVGVVAEWLTTLSPLPLYLAACQYLNLPLIQIASITGIWGVSLLLWGVSAAIADAVLRGTWRTPGLAVVGAALLVVMGFGVLTLARPRPASMLRVAAIQDYQVEDHREAMTRQAVRQGARLVVWSEDCLGSDFAPGDARDPTRQFARSLKCGLVVGYLEQVEPKPFNCVALLNPDGTVAGIHRKIHLFSDERQVTQPGHQVKAFASPLGKVGLAICYDTCFTDVTRELVQSGAQIVALPNYDPPTPRGILHQLHATLQPFRAVENRVPFIRTDSNGLSQVVGADGRIIGQAPFHQAAILARDVALGDGQGTFFTRWGDWLAYGCWLVVLGSMVAMGWQRRKPAAKVAAGGPTASSPPARTGD